MVKTVFAVVVIGYLAVFGVLSIVRPERVRDFYRRQYSKGLGGSKKLPGVSRLTQYNPSASTLRLFGAFSLCSSLLLAYEWFKG
jgi:hypothetical protein